jgi:tetratricopeptide (TPR) repeat protein
MSRARFPWLLAATLATLTSAAFAGSNAIDDVNAANTAFQEGKSDAALDFLNKAIASSELSQDMAGVAHYDRGNIYMSKHNFKAALADYDQAIAERPGYPDAYNMRGNAHFASGDMAAAIADWKTLLQIDPNNAPAHTNLGNAYRAQKQNERALAEYTAALSIGADPSAYQGRAFVYLANGKTELAIADFNEALRLKPSFEVHVNRGNAYIIGGKYEAALADFETALQLKPGNSDALIGRGNAYARLGKQDLAIADYTAAAKGGESDPQLFRQMGDAALAKRDYAQAIAQYDRALAVRPDAGTLLNRGAAYASSGHNDLAIANYTAALRLTPQDPRLYNNRGNAYAAQGKLDRAIADYDAALRIDPKNPDALRNRAGARKAKETGRHIQGD